VITLAALTDVLMKFQSAAGDPRAIMQVMDAKRAMPDISLIGEYFFASRTR